MKNKKSLSYKDVTEIIISGLRDKKVYENERLKMLLEKELTKIGKYNPRYREDTLKIVKTNNKETFNKRVKQFREIEELYYDDIGERQARNNHEVLVHVIVDYEEEQNE